MEKLNGLVYQRYLDAVAAGEKLQRQTFADWAMQIKSEIDPNNMLLFCASDAWLNRFCKRNGIRLKNPKGGDGAEQMPPPPPPRTMVTRNSANSTKNFAGQVCFVNFESKD